MRGAVRERLKRRAANIRKLGEFPYGNSTHSISLIAKPGKARRQVSGGGIL